MKIGIRLQSDRVHINRNLSEENECMLTITFVLPLQEGTCFPRQDALICFCLIVLPHKRLAVRLHVPFIRLLSKLARTVRSSQSVPFEEVFLGCCLFWRKMLFIFPVPPMKIEKARLSLELLLNMCKCEEVGGGAGGVVSDDKKMEF